MRIVIYVRVSTDKQITRNQVMVLTKWVKQAGYNIVAIDDGSGVSGAKVHD